MRLFVLNATISIGYDEYDSFVVRASNEAKARAIATVAEFGDDPSRRYGYSDVWLNPEKSTCLPLSGDGQPGVIVSSYNAG